MIGRRDLLIGAACVTAAGTAYALRPRRHVSLLGDRKLADILPRSFGTWISQDVGNLVAPKVEGSLADRLYNETVERIYHNEATGDEVMLLVAHGDRNTDSLQLHRPETCYPAFGFELTANAPTELVLAKGAVLPGRRLVAQALERRENIVYWSRLGEFLPIDNSEQRRDRLRTAMGGYVADGLLARFSGIGQDPALTFAMIETFIPDLLRATPKAGRGALVGSRLAASMAAAGV